NAGGFGFLPGGYRKPDQIAADIDAVRRSSEAPFGVNLFGEPPERPEEAARVPAFAERVAARAARLGAELGTPAHPAEGVAAKVDRLAELRPAAVSFTFGLP